MIFLLLAALVSQVQAAETSLGVGSTTAGNSTSFQGNYRDMIWGGNYLQFKVGYFDGVHFGVGDGLMLNFKPLFMRGGLGVGPTFGKSILELNPEAYVGFKDTSGNGLGLQFDHFTGAGGRNYISLQMSQDF